MTVLARRVLMIFGVMLVFSALYLVAGTLQAQAAEPTATSMRVSIWPEYDDPRVLVVYEGDLDPSVQLPVDMVFSVPPDADVAMTCEVSPAGGHSCKPFQITGEGDQRRLTYRVERERRFFFEFYYTAFSNGQPQRVFDVPVTPMFPVGELTMEVQEPSRSSGFALAPSFPEQAKDSSGLTYYRRKVSSPAVEEPMVVNVSYSKNDANPSVSGGAAGGLTPAGGSGVFGGNPVVVLVVVLGISLVGFGAYRFMRPSPAAVGGRRSPSGRRETFELAERKTAKKPKGGRRTSKYCTQCGIGLRGSDRFCPECGCEQG